MVWFNRKVLLVENESLLRSLIASTLQFEQFDVAATTSAEAREVAAYFKPHIALLNVDLGNDEEATKLATSLRRKYPKIALVFLSRLGDCGAVDFEAHPALKNAVCIDRADLAKPGVLRTALETADAARAA